MDESEARELIRQNPLKTPADVNRAQTDLSRLLYLVELDTSGAEILKEEQKFVIVWDSIKCSECGASSRTIYFYSEKPFCPEHIPPGITFPIGMHGDDFKAYQDRAKNTKPEEI